MEDGEVQDRVLNKIEGCNLALFGSKTNKFFNCGISSYRMSTVENKLLVLDRNLKLSIFKFCVALGTVCFSDENFLVSRRSGIGFNFKVYRICSTNEFLKSICRLLACVSPDGMMIV